MERNITAPSASETEKFYDGLMEGVEERGVLGKNQRYNVVRILQRTSTKKYFIDLLRPYLKVDDHVLDLGCGPGTFMAAIAPYCGKICGVDISQKFVEAAGETIRRLNLKNAEARHVGPKTLPFPNDHFDALIMVDVIHHLETIDQVLREAVRVVKPGGQFFIFEPNKLNPLIYAMHWVDKNERGLLRLGTPWIYRQILSPYMMVAKIEFNGIVIGPESKIFNLISDFLNSRFGEPFLRWLNPKIMIHGIKR